MQSVWLLVVLFVTVACDTLTQVSTIPMRHAGYTIFADDNVWYRSTRNTLVKQNNELSIPAALQQYDTKIINATASAILFTHNLTSIPFYWTDGKKKMEKFDQLREYQEYSIVDMQNLDAYNKNYVAATMFHKRANKYKVVVMCLQTKTKVDLLTTSAQPSVKPYQPTGVFFYIYTDFTSKTNGYLFQYNPNTMQKLLVQQWSYSVTSMFLVDNAIFYHTGTNELSQYRIDLESVSWKKFDQSVIGVRAVSDPRTKKWLVSTNGDSTYICKNGLFDCKAYPFAAYAFGEIPEHSKILYVPKFTQDKLMSFDIVTEKQEVLIDSLTMNKTRNSGFVQWSRIEYHARSGRVLFIGSELVQKQGIYYEPNNINLFSLDLATKSWNQVTNLVNGQWTIFRTPPFYFKRDGSVAVIKSVNGNDHLFSLKLSGSPYHTTYMPRPTYIEPTHDDSVPERIPIILGAVASVVAAAAVLILFVSVVGFRKFKISAVPQQEVL